MVGAGRALYAGISSYGPGRTQEAIAVCQANGFVKPIIHQPSYSMLNRGVENGLTAAWRMA